MMDDSQLRQTIEFIRGRTKIKPSLGVILGSGLGSIANEINCESKIPYAEIPNFAASSVKGHSGNLIFGLLQNCPVVAMQGRFHVYEGHDWETVTFPVRVMRELGIQTMIVSNAAGGLNPKFAAGDVMLIRSHINLMYQKQKRSENFIQAGRPTRNSTEAYSTALIKRAKQIAFQENFAVQEGTYIAMTGPTYETRAEYRMLRQLGDAAGMSTVPEVIIANHCGLNVLGLSTITNVASPDTITNVSHEEVVEVAKLAERKMSAIVQGIAQITNC